MRISRSSFSTAKQFISIMLESVVNDYCFPAHYRPRLLVTSSDVPVSYIDILRRKCEVTVCTGTSRDEILGETSGAEGILWLTSDRLDGEVLDIAGPQLKVISTMTSGMDYVDAEQFRQRSIALGYTPKVVNDPVADIAIGLMIAAARRFHEGRLKILDSAWEPRPQWMLGQDVVGSTIGIVGFGGIGQTIAKRLRGFDIGRLLYTGHSEKQEAGRFGAQFVSFDELLKESDFVFIACPMTNETSRMFNAKAFQAMKPTSVLINVARGGIVDQPALVEALRKGEIFAAGLDVMTPEPLLPSDPIMKLPNVVIVPHLGTSTRKSLEDMFCITVRNVLSVLNGQRPIASFI
ncbi:glyoxylate reductase/hydroxypyruvate reductase-like [Topomyia yanbarensis]|uniref:glyoxylate reductase/hydroxypyruvate reductase-like n=1 Tax=Topomyia yanbarensis TaxID=2498891 RepID=UPI00273AF239|nr:glyoxylate reductase/hydroxypyruvate reductase-like [Topomyia yanbarensis]XP_058815947.1 glyoxylate reductase/hydroxypyruvate reductase-like [Topomyia yanbarensis]